ncbi:alpha/beta hydrolase [Reyranella massiliensis]|uniref:alpha/beta hydrolase n=1 Tax=Reyranella massiliensis TaxID=445220 RepID=UPI0002F6D2B6|nr:alpha/beta hydrolase [Reyranella massiliensis]
MSTESRTVVWNNMTRAELDAAYDNTSAVADSGERREAWVARSDAFRKRHADGLDLAYGPRPRNKIDLFRCGAAKAPLFAFIHGGYWQRNAKETFACMAAGPLANGMDVAFIGYTLCPEATLSEIVDEIAAAVRWLRREGPHRGAGEGRLVVSGWSAGGHLTATTLAMDEVDAGLAISGIYDVEPCRLNYLNDKLNLTAEEAAKTSPLLHLPKKSAPVVLAYGTGELPELQRQSVAYHDARRAAGLPSELLPLAGLNHFSIMDELEKHDGVLARAARALA